ncbi:MAG: thermonuclease family protein, partial [bacterium]
GVVAAILTGDRIRLNSGHLVRMAGLRAPAHNDPEVGDEVYGSGARRALSELVAGKSVALAYPPKPRLADGELLAFVTLADGTDVNAALIEQGAVHADLATAGAPRRAAFGRLEAEARRTRRGLWGGPVVGNLSSKVYHLPGGRFYYRVGSANRVLFTDEAEARGAGYRRSAR